MSCSSRGSLSSWAREPAAELKALKERTGIMSKTIEVSVTEYGTLQHKLIEATQLLTEAAEQMFSDEAQIASEAGFYKEFQTKI